MSETTRYVALIDGKPGAYGITFPDLPGCTAMGETIDEVMRHAMAAAGDWAQGARGPRPRSLSAVCDDPDVQQALAAGAVLAMVPLVFDRD
jgi:predicted RNase H-like HicB family nuclease